MTEQAIATMTLVLVCCDKHGNVIHAEDVQEVKASSLDEVENLQKRIDRLVAKLDRAEELLARCENEMRYAGWTRFESDNPQRNGLYEQIKGFL